MVESVLKPNSAVDGLPISGKSTAAEILEKVLQVYHNPRWRILPSGEIYRGVGLFFDEFYNMINPKENSLFEIMQKEKEHSVDITENLESILPFMGEIQIELLDEQTANKYLRISHPTFGEREYIHRELRDRKASVMSGRLGKFGPIRPFIVNLEQKLAKDGYYIIHGRDGQVVLNGIPETHPILFYTHCDFFVRVLRRWAKDKEKQGEKNMSFKEIYLDTLLRDSQDTSKEGANLPATPLEASERGYTIVNTTFGGVYKMGFTIVKKTFEELREPKTNHEIHEMVIYSLENLKK
jgi:cytidylate kinase